MERSHPHAPQKSSSFSASVIASNEKVQRRNLSLSAIHYETERIDEEGEEEHAVEKAEEENAGGNEDREEEAAAASQEEALPIEDSLVSLVDDVDQFLGILLGLGEKKGSGNDDGQSSSKLLPEIPESTLGKFVALVDEEISKYETGEEKFSLDHDDKEPFIFDAVDRVSKLVDALSQFSSDQHQKYLNYMNMTSTVQHHTMCFFEDEFYLVLEETLKSSKDAAGGASKTKRSFTIVSHEQEHPIISPTADPIPADNFPAGNALVRLRAIANAMISAGYDIECRQVFSISRRNAFKLSMADMGYEKIAIDDVQRMPWDQLEEDAAKWIKGMRQLFDTTLPLERDLCHSVFAGHREIADEIFYSLASHTTRNLLNFPEAVAMTKRSAEKLFKVLDMYEALKEITLKLDRLFPLEGKEKGDEDKKAEEKPEKKSSEAEENSEERPEGEGDKGESEEESSSQASHLKTELSAVKMRLGEAAVAIFCELENSIKSDAGKNAVPGGAVHPLSRYVVNYLKYACEYVSTLEQIFKDHRQTDEGSDDDSSHGVDGHNRGSSSSSKNHGVDQTPFEAQLMQVMDLLQSNLDSKAKLYKEMALSNIFLMNNGRYIVQKIKGSPEINVLLGNTWCRKRSSDLRQYHKNYQRETWSKVLACFKDEGLTAKGSVHKPVLKERFKSFNALFDEIHKVQSSWIVSDEQLQSELRVSISAVVIPAYRSFLARFSQYLDAGRQTEKYIKFTAEDIENAIDDLFEGNVATMIKRR